MEKPLIFDFDYAQLAKIFQEWDEPGYRIEQTWQALYKQMVPGVDGITTLSKKLRGRLEDRFRFSGLEFRHQIRSQDGSTQKFLFGIPGGDAIETVLMRYKRRNTLCISTQAGCAMGCTFCATGQMGFKQNLSSGQIIEQVLFISRRLEAEGLKPTNIVLMGMGEPFHNYEATLAAIDRLNDPRGFNFGARRFTISTVGLIPQIERFTLERRQVNLAVSLHAADDVLRSQMLPINQRYPIQDLIKASERYVMITGRRITFEWALIEGVNDTPEQARALGNLIQGFPSHVNLIPLNPTRAYDGKPSTRGRVKVFQEILEGYGVPTTIRVRRGIEIHAGCGQLVVEEAREG